MKEIVTKSNKQLMSEIRKNKPKPIRGISKHLVMIDDDNWGK
jgi:hypothetical protein